MSQYRLHFVDDDGNSYDVVPIDGADDTDAVRQAEAQTEGQAAALWFSNRLVRTFKANLRYMAS